MRRPLKSSPTWRGGPTLVWTIHQTPCFALFVPPVFVFLQIINQECTPELCFGQMNARACTCVCAYICVFVCVCVRHYELIEWVVESGVWFDVLGGSACPKDKAWKPPLSPQKPVLLLFTVCHHWARTGRWVREDPNRSRRRGAVRLLAEDENWTKD